MKKIFIIALLIMVSICSHAQKRVLSMEQCVDFALENNYGMMAANKSVERARSLQGTAWDIDKTELSVSQDPTSGGSPDNAISISQTIDFPTVYVAKRKLLKAETKAEQSKMAVTAAQLKTDVASAYCDLLFINERMAILKQQDSILTRFRDVIKKNYEAGEVRQLELLSANKLLMECGIEMSSARAEQATAYGKLSTLMNTKENFDIVQSQFEPTKDYELEIFNYAKTPDSEYAADRMTVAERAVCMEKSGYSPSLSVALRNQLVFSSWNPYNEDRSRYKSGNFMGFEVGVSVPLFFGANKARVKAAKKNQEQLAMEIYEEKSRMKQEYAAMQNNCMEAYNRYKLLNEEVKGNTAYMMQLAMTEYENGEISYLEFIAAQQQVIEVSMKRATAINDFNQGMVRLWRYGRK